MAASRETSNPDARGALIQIVGRLCEAAVRSASDKDAIQWRRPPQADTQGFMIACLSLADDASVLTRNVAVFKLE